MRLGGRLLLGALGVGVLVVGWFVSRSFKEERPARGAPRVVLIGVDGGSWNLIDPMMADGRLPALAALRDRGVSAALASVEPLNSPTVWTSIATGRNPRGHGVSFFYDNRYSVRVPTVWERLAAGGRRVGLYDYLVTWPPRTFPAGFVVPGWLRKDASVTPPDLFARLGLPAYAYSLEGVVDPEAIVTAIQREPAEKARYWNKMSETFDLEAGAVVFYAVDAASHRFWHAAFPQDFDSPPTPVASNPRFGGVIHETLEAVDRAIGEIVDALDPEDHVVVVSDHGFQPMPRVETAWDFDVPWLLARAGLEAEDDGITVISDWRLLMLRLDPGPVAEREATLERIRSLLASVRSPGGDPVFDLSIVHPERAEDAWVGRPAWQVEFAKGVLRRFAPGHAFVFAQPIPQRMDPLASIGTVEIGDQRFDLSRFSAAHEFAGDHHATGIFLAAGGAIRRSLDRHQLSVIDIAPLVTFLAGEPIPDDIEGRLPEALLEPDYLRRFPPRSVAAADAPRLADDAEPEDMEGDAKLKQRLQALGYI